MTVANTSKNLSRRFTLFDLIVIAIVAALGIAIKPVLIPLIQIITGPLFIPGGAIVGGFYMMWIVVGAGIVGKRGTASLIAVVQAIVVIAIGMIGTHGIMSLATYMLPGVAVDILLLATKGRAQRLIICFFAGLVANVTGTFLTNFVFFRLPLVPLLLVLASGALSGALGGLIAYGIIKGVKRIKLPGIIR